MADKYSLIEVGDCLDIAQSKIIPCKCAAAVTKGQVVKASAHVNDDLPTVQPQAAGTTNTSIGVALKTGDTGEVIPVLIYGIVKVTAGSGGTTVGTSIVATPSDSADGTVASATTTGSVIGKALQTLSSGDTGLVLINAGGG